MKKGTDTVVTAGRVAQVGLGLQAGPCHCHVPKRMPRAMRDLSTRSTGREEAMKLDPRGRSVEAKTHAHGRMTHVGRTRASLPRQRPAR